MNIEISHPIDRDKWLAALQVKGSPDDTLRAQMKKAEELLMIAAKPRATYRIMQRNQVKTKGFAIETHLEGCQSVAVMAATLGAEVDSLIRKTQITDMALAVIIDSGASVLTEQICDDFQVQIKKELKSDRFITNRFSPGYGDYPLTEQARILKYLDAQKLIGLNVTSGSLLTPRKSVTALIGIADHFVSGRPITCSQCAIKDKCILKKEGRFCGD